jgi:uncharacterized protein YqeY
MTEIALKQRISEDVKSAMRSKDQKLLGTLRLLTAGIKQREVDERITLDDAQILAVIDKMIKQRRDSIEQYQAAKRQDLVDQESYEVAVLQRYLPTSLSDAEISQLIKEAINETGAKSVQEMGRVMAVLKPKLQGRADIGVASAKVKEHLQQLNH